MNAEENKLWKKISLFNLDDESSAFKFSTRLAQENGWSLSFAKLVIAEYKKFIFLCCVSKTGVTPSDQVDQVWHLHLTYTKSYWIELCKNTINKEIHHNPTKGGNSEAKKFDNYYSETLKLYREKFGKNAPKDIWPENDQRFSDINFQRVNLKKNWIINKPSLKNKTTVIILILILSSVFIQAYISDDDLKFTIIAAILIVALIVYYSAKKNKSQGGCSGNGDSGCGGHTSSHSHHSGDSDSGCSSSGCSGCGGSGCGD